jgi:light-regulated signal transduction histidine kinase (bacteriophytochrome)
MQPSVNDSKASGNTPLADERSKLIPGLDQFISTAIHDLRAPLNSSAALAQLLLKKFGGELQAEARWLTEQIVTQLERQRAIIAGLEEFAAVVNNATLHLAAISLNSVITAALGNLEKEILESGANVTRSAMPVVIGDGAQLEVLFQHILANAIRYHSSSSPTIDITAECDENRAKITVRDNGLGFGEEYAEAIFEPFKRLHSPMLPGAGLGLATCRKIVDRHRGRL